MFITRPHKIVVLGMMSYWPVAGVAWVTMQYVEGFRRLGYDVYYVEAHGRAPGKFMETDEDDGAARAADYIARIMARFDMDDRWAYHDVHDTGRCFGLSREQLYALYGSAAMILNLHGATEPLPEHAATGRLVYLHTDPVEVEIEIEEGNQYTIDFLAAHCAHFTWGLNYGNPDCLLPVSDRFPMKHSPPVVVTDFWQGDALREAVAAGGKSFALSDTFTTVGNWRQHKQVVYKGEVYHWSKHLEFLKFLDLPARSGAKFELALSAASYNEEDERLLNDHGWSVRDALVMSADMDTYRRYLAGSRGEFTVAKDENIRLRSGWFSERSAQYLAAGKPVITQDTAFGNAIPTGEGLFVFSTMEQILAAVEAINGDYERHCRAAAALARDYFNYDVVLERILEEVPV